MQVEELARPAVLLAQRFIQRWDVYPQQLDDGRYICHHEKLNVTHLYAHLRGEITLGTYLLNQVNKVRFIVLDNDLDTGWEYLVTCGSKLANAGIPTYLEKSRRGGHLWIFFEKPTNSYIARQFAHNLMDNHHLKDFELYPKQDRVENGLGSLIRLPFGIHRLTGKRYGFYDSNGVSLGNTLREQISVFQRLEFVSKDILKQYRHISPSSEVKARPKRLHESRGPLSERIKTRVTALEFISQYVDLRPTESGAIGLCPFHDDQHPSFGVNDIENYWYCFAGCGGGSIIDFWSLWRKKRGLDPGFVPTITELAKILF